MNEWVQIAVQVLGPGIPALCGLGVFGLKVLDRWDQRRAIERAMASPEALKALQAIPEPSLLLDKAGPVALAFVLAGGGIGLLQSGVVAASGTPAAAQCSPRELPYFRSGCDKMAQMGVDFVPDTRPAGLPVYTYTAEVR